MANHTPKSPRIVVSAAHAVVAVLRRIAVLMLIGGVVTTTPMVQAYYSVAPPSSRSVTLLPAHCPPRRLLVAPLSLSSSSSSLPSPPKKSSNSNNGNNHDDEHQQEQLKQDIATLRNEAALRLEALLQQMEELKQFNSAVVAETSTQPALLDSTTTSSTSSKAPLKAPVRTATPPTPITTTAEEPSLPQSQPPQYEHALRHAPAAWLDETVWKIAFNIGRESGSWFPPPWGNSGDRLLFQCTVDFTGVPTSNVFNNDEFFHTHTSNPNNNENICQLAVTEAFVLPRGVGAHSIGRRPLPVQPVGAYQVCRGEGPAGTDIVRLCIELTDTVRVLDHDSDVYCPAGRVYGTCGYYAIPQHDTTTTSSSSALSYRDAMQQQHLNAVRDYERLQQSMALEDGANNQFSLQHWQTKQKLWKAKQRMEQTLQQYQTAKLQEPEKSQLRLSKAGNIGLSREGGVCVKVRKGLALEYHILGRMEVGCVQDHHGQSSSSSSSSQS